MKIIVKIKNVFGNDLIYPLCCKAIAFTRLTKKKTLDRTDLKYIKELGYEIEVETIKL